MNTRNFHIPSAFKTCINQEVNDINVVYNDDIFPEYQEIVDFLDIAFAKNMINPKKINYLLTILPRYAESYNGYRNYETWHFMLSESISAIIRDRLNELAVDRYLLMSQDEFYEFCIDGIDEHLDWISHNIKYDLSDCSYSWLINVNKIRSYDIYLAIKDEVLDGVTLLDKLIPNEVEIIKGLISDIYLGKLTKEDVPDLLKEIEQSLDVDPEDPLINSDIMKILENHFV